MGTNAGTDISHGLALFSISAGDSHVWPFFLTGGCNVILPKPVLRPAGGASGRSGGKGDGHANCSHPAQRASDSSGLEKVMN